MKNLVSWFVFYYSYFLIQHKVNRSDTYAMLDQSRIYKMGIPLGASAFYKSPLCPGIVQTAFLAS